MNNTPEPNWRLWKVCEMRHGGVRYYEDYKKFPCSWPKCTCERRPKVGSGGDNRT